MTGQASPAAPARQQARPAGAAGPLRGSRQSGPGTRARRRGSGALPYLLPALVFLLVWIYLPLAFTGVLSFLHWNLVGASRPFAGLSNYARLFARPDFAAAATQTALYVAGLVPFATVFPMGMAIMLWKHPGRAAAAYRSLLFLPVVLAPVAVAIAWQFLLAPLEGAVDTLLAAAGLPAPDWLGSASTALWTIVVITGIRIFALNVLIYLAGLAAIDRACVEAARVDGASEWAITRHILVPLLGRTTALASFLCVVFGGQWAFVNIAVLTQGGPQGATSNVFYLLYQYGFAFFDTGLASAAAVVITLALAVAVVAHQVAARKLATGDA